MVLNREITNALPIREEAQTVPDVPAWICNQAYGDHFADVSDVPTWFCNAAFRGAIGLAKQFTTYPCGFATLQRRRLPVGIARF